MNPELERLIDLAVADGTVTDKELEVLYRKAKQLDADIDEFEMVLEAKLHLAQKAANTSQQPTTIGTTPGMSQKEGDTRRCPSCGAMALSFATTCADCGYEFRGTQATHSVIKLFDMLNKLEETRAPDETNPLKALGAFQSKMFSGQSVFGGGKLDKQKKELIRNFPIPNTKEDLLEFLFMAVPRATKKGGMFAKFGDQGWENIAHNELVPVWKTKCQEIIMKARFAMKDDKRTSSEIERYASILKIK